VGKKSKNPAPKGIRLSPVRCMMEAHIVSAIVNIIVISDVFRDKVKA